MHPFDGKVQVKGPHSGMIETALPEPREKPRAHNLSTREGSLRWRELTPTHPRWFHVSDTQRKESLGVSIPQTAYLK